MSNLAIKGHATRGEEVIEILEMLGGKNTFLHYGDNSRSVYYIDKSNRDYISRSYTKEDCDCVIFTLEEFIEKYPYKVGDKVQHRGATSCGSIFEVEKMRWEENTVKYTLRLFGCNYKSSTLPAEYLQPYKDETMEKEISGAIIDRFICLEGYDFYDDKGNIINTKEITMEKKHPEYPKTYEECCEILMDKTNFQDFSLVLAKLSTNINEENSISPEPPHITLINNFYKLLICRDAYWKIAGDWKPDEEKNDGEYIYCISYQYAEFELSDELLGDNYILSFPTAEMRDAFYENFKELIEECKGFL